MTLEILTIPCLADNYAFLLRDQATGKVALVDAPESYPIQAALKEKGWKLDLVLLTHHHYDHVDGLPELVEEYRPQVIGAKADAHRLPSFRAPTLLQSGGSLTRVMSVVDPLSPARAVFRNMVISGNPDVDPEESTSYNVGITLEPAAGPLQGLSFNLDYWNLDMKDIITIENPQGIANANPLDPRILRNPISGRIGGFLLEFVNANSIDASGFDMSLGLVHDFRSAGVMNFGVKSSHIFDFDLDDPTLGELDGAGNRNFTNFARALPEWRVNTTFGWSVEGHSASVIARYISGYQDDDNARHIADNVTFDVQYSYEVPQLWDEYQSPTISIGAINVLDQDPPRVATDPGFDSKVHSPLGRVLYVKLKQPIY